MHKLCLKKLVDLLYGLDIDIHHSKIHHHQIWTITWTIIKDQIYPNPQCIQHPIIHVKNLLKNLKKNLNAKKNTNNPIEAMDSMHSNDSNNMDSMMNNIIGSTHGPSRGPQSKEISYSMPDPYNQRDTSIRKFPAQTSQYISDTNYSGPPLPNKSIPTKSKKKLSLTSINSIELNDINEKENSNDDIDIDIDINNNNNNKGGINGSPEFGAEYKPNNYKQKADLRELDLEMERAFMQSDSSEDDDEEEERDDSDNQNSNNNSNSNSNSNDDIDIDIDINNNNNNK
eukprot:801858_1